MIDFCSGGNIYFCRYVLSRQIVGDERCLSWMGRCSAGSGAGVILAVNPTTSKKCIVGQLISKYINRTKSTVLFALTYSNCYNYILPLPSNSPQQNPISAATWCNTTSHPMLAVCCRCHCRHRRWDGRLPYSSILRRI
jgi:hypothetical protein